jgi:hypothetical protein
VLLKDLGANPVAKEVCTALDRVGEHITWWQLFRSLTSGDVINREWMRYSFPTTWHYDVLRGLDYLRSAGVQPYERLAQAVDIVEKRRHDAGH